MDKVARKTIEDWYFAGKIAGEAYADEYAGLAKEAGVLSALKGPVAKGLGVGALGAGAFGAGHLVGTDDKQEDIQEAMEANLPKAFQIGLMRGAQAGFSRGVQAGYMKAKHDQSQGQAAQA